MNIEEKIREISRDGEQWKPCPEFENKYLISSHGRILGIGTYNTCKKGELIKQFKKNGRNGYMQVRLYDGGRAKTFEVHTLVAKAFIPNPNSLPMVNHIDEDKTNNCIENLEWCTNKYNIRYSQTKKVDVYTKDGEFIETLDAVIDASAKYNIPTSNISRCCLSKDGTTKGYQFRYHGNPFIPKPPKIAKVEKLRHKGILPREAYYVPINEYSISGEFIKTWENISMAAKANSTTTGNICKCYKGEILTNKGKIFLTDNNISERLKLLKNRKHKSKTEYV